MFIHYDLDHFFYHEVFYVLCCCTGAICLFSFLKRPCSFACMTKLSFYRYDVAAFLSHRLFETGDPVMTIKLLLNIIDVVKYISGSSYSKQFASTVAIDDSDSDYL